ncbi:sulfite exporter TauE/SafE family protein [Micromonospora haikouensis]|uniref:sulfite exporter TauE/SafE family protein n=1 Tax=Micromonospora haikouensis TaxID=686309 RepID=UPI0009E50F12|nr:sulfite exporter TauE/SafE family protein [Micromonospora haikouensis]
MNGDVLGTLAAASAAAFALAWLSAVAGFGGGVLLLPMFTALFGLRVAVPMLTLTQLSSNGARVWFNRRDLNWPLVGWFTLGAVPCAVVGALLFAHAPLEPLKRTLGVFLIAVVLWRRINPHPRRPADRTFTGLGAASGLGSARWSSVRSMFQRISRGSSRGTLR